MSTRNPIGALRKRVTLEAPSDTSDEIGGVTRNFTALADVWTHIEPLQGMQRYVADRNEESVTHRIRMRFRPAVDASMRFRLGERIFMIRAVNDFDERGHTLVCHCEEIKP